MARLTFQYLARGSKPAGWRFFWARVVTGVASWDEHCIGCLKADRVKEVSKEMDASKELEIEVPDVGAFLYICGGSSPYILENNFHLVVRPGNGLVRRSAYNGEVVSVSGALRYLFDDRAARALFPDRGPEFLTCRNFQFVAQEFGHEAEG